MIESSFYLIAAYLAAALTFGALLGFFLWRGLFLCRQIDALEKRLADKKA